MTLYLLFMVIHLGPTPPVAIQQNAVPPAPPVPSRSLPSSSDQVALPKGVQLSKPTPAKRRGRS